jgi:hypothetical protein
MSADGKRGFEPYNEKTYAEFYVEQQSDAGSAEINWRPHFEWLNGIVGKIKYHDFRTPVAAAANVVGLFAELHDKRARIRQGNGEQGAASRPRMQTRSSSGGGAGRSISGSGVGRSISGGSIARSISGASAAGGPKR